MNQKLISPLQEALEFVEALSTEEQEALIELIQHRLVELRRAEICQNAKETLKSIQEGGASYGSSEDLKRELMSDQ